MAGVLVATGFSGSGGGIGTMLRRDAQGELQSVPAITSSSSEAPLPPLWKPEPQLLLDRSDDLGLTAAQRSRIGDIQERWAKDRTSIESELDALQTSVDERAGLSELKQKLQPAAELSRAYDRARAGYWQEATAILTRAQRDHIEVIKGGVK